MASRKLWPTLPATMDAESKLCQLHLTLGEVDACPGGACPFWEQGGIALPAGCELERLSIDLDRPELAEYLLELRQKLEDARDREEHDAARKAFAELVPPDLSGR
jgi:hypothetical protein